MISLCSIFELMPGQMCLQALLLKTKLMQIIGREKHPIYLTRVENAYATDSPEDQCKDDTYAFTIPAEKFASFQNAKKGEYSILTREKSAYMRLIGDASLGQISDTAWFINFCPAFFDENKTPQSSALLKKLSDDRSKASEICNVMTFGGRKDNTKMTTCTSV